MKPRPRPRHLAAVVILATVAAIFGSMAAVDSRVSEGQVHIATAALRSEYHDLYPVDRVYATGGPWRLNSPAFLGLLQLVLVPTGFVAPLLPFRCLVGVLTVVYLSGMYAVLYRQTRSWSISVYVAILSSAMVFTIGRWFWGVGILEAVTPAALVVAAAPLIVLAFLEHQDDWRIVLVFLFIGLLGNIHLSAALNLSFVLIVAFLGQRRFNLSAWPTAVACALATAVGAVPYAAYFLTLRSSLTRGEVPDTAAHAVQGALRAADFAVLYPELLNSVLSWALYAALLIIPAAAVLVRFERYAVRDKSFWVWVILAGLAISMGLQGLGQALGAVERRVPLVTDFIQASVLVMFAIYVLFAQALVHLFRIVRTHRTALRWALAAVAALWLLPSDNARPLRHGFYHVVAALTPSSAEPQRVIELRLRARQEEDLRNIALWARDRTDLSAIFLTEDIAFRMASRRSLLASRADIDAIYHLPAGRVQQWLDDIQDQKLLLQPSSRRPNPAELAAWVDDLSRRPRLQNATAWYAIFPAAASPAESDRVVEIRPDRSVQPLHWGEHYRLFVIKPPAP